MDLTGIQTSSPRRRGTIPYITGPRPSRLCHNVIAREGNDRSNLISSRIHKITTTPERRLVMTKKNYDTVCFAGVTTAAAFCPIKKDGDFFCLCVYGKNIIQYITACYSRSRDSIHICHAGLDPASRKIKLVPGTRAFQCIRRDDD